MRFEEDYEKLQHDLEEIPKELKEEEVINKNISR